ncbi:cyclic lactone autoinducer peptide [Cohnella sp.]
MSRLLAKLVSSVLNRIAVMFVKTASPVNFRPEIPQELKK